MTPSVDNDPTLRTGDIVATNAGMMAYSGSSNGDNKRRVANSRRSSPIRASPPDVRQRLAETKIVPSDGTAAPIKIAQPRDHGSVPAVSKAKRAQATPPAPAQQQGWRPPWFW